MDHFRPGESLHHPIRTCLPRTLTFDHPDGHVPRRSPKQALNVHVHVCDPFVRGIPIRLIQTINPNHGRTEQRSTPRLRVLRGKDPFSKRSRDSHGSETFLSLDAPPRRRRNRTEEREILEKRRSRSWYPSRVISGPLVDIPSKKHASRSRTRRLSKPCSKGLDGSRCFDRCNR